MQNSEIMQENMTNGTRVTNAVRLVGESMLPGASLMMDGKLANGAIHALLGFGARALAGPAGIALIAADSYSKSVSGKYLWDHVTPYLKRNRNVEVEAVDAAEVEVVADTGKSGKSAAKPA